MFALVIGRHSKESTWVKRRPAKKMPGKWWLFPNESGGGPVGLRCESILASFPNSSPAFAGHWVPGHMVPAEPGALGSSETKPQTVLLSKNSEALACRCASRLHLSFSVSGLRAGLSSLSTSSFGSGPSSFENSAGFVQFMPSSSSGFSRR